MIRQKNQSLLFFVLDPENVHRLQSRHLAEVERLTLKTSEYLFGYKTAEFELTRSCLSLGIYNDEEDLCGVLCLNSFPNVPSVPPWEWAHWLHNLYEVDVAHPLTALWVHYSVWDRRYTSIFMNPMLQSLFTNNETLEHVYWVCPPGFTRVDFIEDVATRILPVGFTNPSKVQTIYVANRVDFVSHYTIRKAVEEDNDDLVAIIPQIVEDYYGHYYISEILNNTEQMDRQIIVSEHRGTAVGVLCLNEMLNYDLLNEEFELVPYNGLKTPDVEDTIILKPQMGSHTTNPPVDDVERLSSFVFETTYNDDESLEADDNNDSEDEFSLLNLSSSLILNYLYDDSGDADVVGRVGSASSIESHFSAVVLNAEYSDHVFNADRGGDYGYAETYKPTKMVPDAAEIPVFAGDPNAFSLEICSALPEHEASLYLLFQAAFECFPDRDYCVASFPSDSTNFYLMKHFARVVPRPGSVFTHDLYVLHRNAVQGKLSVRVAVPEDKDAVSEMIVSMLKPTFIEEAFKEAVDIPSSPTKGYVFLCGDQIIGCAALTEEDEQEYLEFHYGIEEWVNPTYSRMGSRGALEVFLVSPIFQRHVGFFLRELHRLSNFTVLFYRLRRYDYLYTHRTLPLINCLMNMAPVLPSPVPEYGERVVEEFQLPNTLSKKHQPFSLYLSTPSLTSLPKIEINQRIVVVGAGFTALSFLESLLFGRNQNALVTFTNVTVVCPHGISYHKQPSPIRDMVFVQNGRLDRRYVESICLKTYVNLVTGVMTSINRKEKYVGLIDDSYLPYDYLFLMCGEQFQKPPQKREVVRDKRREFPTNVFIINTEADAGNAFEALKHMSQMHKQSGTIVVYGHCLDACCCLAALLEFGVAGSNLVFVDPHPDYNSAVKDRHDHLTLFFNNSHVETAVFNEILSQGITIYQDYNFVEWHMSPTDNNVLSAKFESKYKFVEIELSALFIYYEKGVSMRTFQAITKSGLVFNGHLVIDKNYQTNDPFIYGAGPLTMYSKKYHAEHLMHKYYNGEETGYNLGQEIRRKLIPKEYWDTPSRPVVRRRPVVQYCRFPGNLYYLHVSKPGRPIPLDVATSKSTYGRILVTGDCRKLDKKGYFRLHLNQYNTVETITCLAKHPLEVQNLTSLWGRHEAFFNNLVLRYDLNLISDLYEYFKQPWLMALYHKRFNRVLEEIDQMFVYAETGDGKSLFMEVWKTLENNDWRPLSKLQADEIEEIANTTEYMKQIEEIVVEFLQDYYIYLPMYVHMMFIRWIMHQIQTSPLFVKTTFIPEHENKVTGQVMPFFQKGAGRSSKGNSGGKVKQRK